MKRLLILSGSAQKVRGTEPIPAIMRYDGPFYQTLRKFLNEHPAVIDEIDVWVLSAHYGLISSSTVIDKRDEELTGARGTEIRDSVQAMFRKLCAAGYDEICVNLGRKYLQLLGEMPPSVTIIDGGLGTRLGALRRWLYAGIA
jgi:hypothetical protein